MPMLLFGVMRDLDESSLAELADIIGVPLAGEPSAIVLPTAPPPPAVPQPPQPSTSARPFYDAQPESVRRVIARHWPQQTWERAAMIGHCESGWVNNAHNTNGEDSRGWWQVNVVPQANPDLLELGNLFDPNVNARAAVKVWARQGWRAWLNCARRLGIPETGPGVA
ncbi:MAG: hypothetical protein O2816_05030 [Planctomycetota bacterium]|nr:hypothetical protein [Planctomycetota bacterium]